MTPDGGSDEDLAAAARRGDAVALDGLIRRFARPVYSVCRQILGNAADAEDAAQELFARMLRELGKYDPGRRFPPWIFKMTANVAHNFNRSRGRRELREARPATPAARTESGAGSEEMDRIAAAIEELPPKYGLALIYKFRQELSHEEIGELMDIPADSVRVLVFRALALLRGKVGVTA